MSDSNPTCGALLSSVPAPASTWQPVAGFTWELFCIAVSWISCFGIFPVIIYWMNQGASPGSIFWLCVWSYVLLTYKVTSKLSDRYRKRQRSVLIGAEQLLATDSRPPVLYLRCFRDDETTSRLEDLSSEEQELAMAMMEIGPFISFGDPDKASAQPGAARLYVDHASWQQRVVEVMTSAKLVVARIANSPSFEWEIRTSLKLLQPEKLVLLLPNEGEVYEKFRLNTGRIFPRPLPRKNYSTVKGHISTEGLLYFKSDWTPEFLKFKTSHLHHKFWAPGVPTLKFALRPVYEQLGVGWSRPPVQIPLLVAGMLLVLTLVYALYAAVLQVLKFMALLRDFV